MLIAAPLSPLWMCGRLAEFRHNRGACIPGGWRRAVRNVGRRLNASTTVVTELCQSFAHPVNDFSNRSGYEHPTPLHACP